jgi:hypothetical protein
MNAQEARQRTNDMGQPVYRDCQKAIREAVEMGNDSVIITFMLNQRYGDLRTAAECRAGVLLLQRDGFEVNATQGRAEDEFEISINW